MLVVRPSGRGLHALAPGSAPAFSPDGRTVLYHREYNSLGLVNADGTGDRAVLENSSPSSGSLRGDPTWSPDGDRVVAVSVPIYALEMRLRYGRVSGGWEEYGPTGEHPAWSPDGRRLAFDDGCSISVVAPGSLVPRPLVRGFQESGGRCLRGGISPEFSPDGRWVAYWRMRNGAEEDVYVVRARGGPPRRIVDTRPTFLGGDAPAWSPDGRRIAYTARGREARIYTVPVRRGRRARGRRVLVARDGWNPSWQPLPRRR